MKHIYGNGVPKDNELAVRMLTQSHDMGHVRTTYNLGICYHYGYGSEVDLAKAYDLYPESANDYYGKGKGVGIPRKKQVGTHRICFLPLRGQKAKIRALYRR